MNGIDPKRKGEVEAGIEVEIDMKDREMSAIQAECTMKAKDQEIIHIEGKVEVQINVNSITHQIKVPVQTDMVTQLQKTMQRI